MASSRRTGARLVAPVLVGSMLVALTFAGSPAVAATTEYQAETATISQGVVESNHAGYTGTGFVNYTNVAGSYVQWTVTAAAAGSQTLAIRFANGTTTNRPMDITVNGSLARDEAAFAGTGAWTSWQETSFSVALQAGTNTIRATATTANGGPNVDRISVGDASTPGPGAMGRGAV